MGNEDLTHLEDNYQRGKNKGDDLNMHAFGTKGKVKLPTDLRYAAALSAADLLIKLNRGDDTKMHNVALAAATDAIVESQYRPLTPEEVSMRTVENFNDELSEMKKQVGARPCRGIF